MFQELDQTSEEISNDFSEDTKILFTKDLINQKSKIEQIYNQLNSIVISTSDSGRKKISKDYLVILKNAYRIIMWSREFFTGQQIDYRIYYSSNSKSTSLGKNVKIYHLNEEDILNLVTVDGTALKLRASFTQALQNQEQDSQREAIFDKHWQDIFKGLIKSDFTKQTAYVVTDPIFEKYKSNQGLGKDIYNKTAFNRGNLYESFDATADDVYSKILKTKIKDISSIYSRTVKTFEQKYFGFYLKHDNIKGFQTGDVDLTQIKARKAQLIELGTLKLYLKDILDILNMVNGNSSKSKLKKRIRSMFVDPEMKKISPELNKIIDEKVEEILKYIKN